MKVIRKGYMAIHNLGIMKGGSRDYWFVLSSESLSWYKDGEVCHHLRQDLVVSSWGIFHRRRRKSTCCPWRGLSWGTWSLPLCLVGICLQFIILRVETSSKTSRFYNPFDNHMNNYMNLFYKTLDLSCETQDDMDSWKASFLRAGVYPEKQSSEGTVGDGEEAVSQDS